MEWPHLLLLCGTVGFLVSSSSAVPTGEPTKPSIPSPATSDNKTVADDHKSGWQSIQDAYFALTSLRSQLADARERLQEAYDNDNHDAARELVELIRDLQQQLQEAYNNLTALTG
ncbi:Hypp1790 [Branchiostoma lanceolatum]|uniref:Hypp1790 protein n=1 Tax=Branchiostoma lanceolatum TaxID=7740 RepID=A0A8J9ZM13_BRALA|nr:Hypp1790 [Branchiostoma lanceolatum]